MRPDRRGAIRQAGIMKHAPLSRRSLLAAASLSLPALTLPGWARAQDALPAGPFRFTARDGQSVEAVRGYFDVPEDRRDPRSRWIRLGYVKFPSTAARPGPPIVYLAGGPGGEGTGAATGPRFPIFMALREVADVIAFDQRGTGLSNHIPERAAPTGPWPALTRDGLTEHFRAEMARAWDDWTRAGVAMGGYNTEQSADDVDDLRRHLGAETVNLWGISYGSHLGLSIVKRHGDRIGRVALASLEGQDQTVKSPAHADAYLRRVDAVLGADPAARAVVPDLSALMRRVHDKLEAEPAILNVATPDGPVDLTLGAFGVQYLAGGLIANPPTLSMLPGLYLALEAGETSGLAPFFGDVAGLFSVRGMPEFTDLASGITAGRLARIEQEARTAVLGDALNFPMPHVLGAVPGVDLGDAFRAPIRISTPALLFSGTLDGRTPMEEQAEVATQFQNGARVVVENAGHNVFEAHPDNRDLLVRFFRGEAVGDTQLSLPPPRFAVG